MKTLKPITILAVLILQLWMTPQLLAQDHTDEEIDSLIILFKSAGRDWNGIAEQFIAIGEPSVLPLIGVLQDTSLTQWTRRIAAMTLNDIHSQTYIEPALQILMDSSEDPVLRNQVTNGLKGHDLSHVADELWEIFQEAGDNWFRSNIADILSTSNPALASLGYETLFIQNDGYLRQHALMKLVLLNPQQSADLYLAALQGDDWMTANLAMDSLATTGQFPFGRISRLFHRVNTPEIVRWRIIHVLGQRPEENYMDLYLEALSDPGWLVYNEAAVALARMPPEKVLPDLRYLAQSDDAELAERVGWVIDQFETVPGNERASMQPFEGYPMITDLDEIKELLREKCVDTITFRKGEIIADVGAGNGYLEAMLSIFHDDLTFYIQDIDPTVCNPVTVHWAVEFYQQVNGGEFTNDFEVVNGTDTDTRLPDQTFDKILMLWTYQYLKEPVEFMTGLREKLKNDGLLYVINPDQDYEYGRMLSIEFGWNGSTVEKQVSDIIGCGFELLEFARNHNTLDQPYIMVFRKK